MNNPAKRDVAYWTRVARRYRRWKLFWLTIAFVVWFGLLGGIFVFGVDSEFHAFRYVVLALPGVVGVAAMLNAAAYADQLAVRASARVLNKPPILVLRSFGEVMLTAAIETVPAGQYHFQQVANKDTLHYVVEALTTFTTVYLIGGDERHLTKAIVIRCADDEWRTAWTHVAARAAAIVVFPEATRGVSEELRFIDSSRFTNKTIVLMSPDLAGKPGARAKRWAEVKTLHEAVGFLLPPYQSEGMCYVPHEDFSVACASVPFENSAEGWTSALAALETHLPPFEPTASVDEMLHVDRITFESLLDPKSKLLTLMRGARSVTEHLRQLSRRGRERVVGR